MPSISSLFIRSDLFKKVCPCTWRRQMTAFGGVAKQRAAGSADTARWVWVARPAAIVPLDEDKTHKSGTLGCTLHSRHTLGLLSYINLLFTEPWFVGHMYSISIGNGARSHKISCSSPVSLYFRYTASTSLHRLGLRRGEFACVGWKVTLCDPIRQATPCSSEMDTH